MAVIVQRVVTAAQDAPIAFTPDSEPYDPNDTAAVAAYWSGATIKRGLVNA